MRRSARRRRGTSFCIAALVVTSAACGASSDSSDPSVATTPTTESSDAPTTGEPAASEPASSEPASTEADADDVAATDPSASEPTAQRIVVSDQATLDAALALGLPVVGTPGYSDREAIPAYLAELAGDVEILAERSQVNLESLAAARPDLLLFSSKLVEESGAREALEEIAELASLDISTATPWRDALRAVAEAAGVPDRAEARIAEVDATIAAAREAIGPDGLATEVSVVRCFGTSCRYLPGGTSFSGQILDELGVARPEIQRSDPEGRAFVEVSPERADLLDGDLIVLFGTDADDTIEQLRQNPLWERLGAVQDGNVVEVDPAPWFTGNALAVEAIVADMVRLLG